MNSTKSCWAQTLLGFLLIALGVWLSVSAWQVLSTHHAIRKVLILLCFSLIGSLYFAGLQFLRGRWSLSVILSHLRQHWIDFTLMPLLSLLLFLGVLEIGLRVYDGLIADKTSTIFIPTGKHALLGWENKAHFKAKLYPKGYEPLIYTSKEHGFRVFDDVQTTQTKVLVLGDSYTQAKENADGKAYYDYLKAHLPNTAFFVYGSGGYGSLQEYLILDRYIDLIKPDMILWQFCFNDYIDNDLDLHMRTRMNAQYLSQPFWVNEKMQLIYPNRFGLVLQHSLLLRLVHAEWNSLMRELAFEPEVEFQMTPESAMFKRTWETTKAIMAMVKQRAGATPVVAFSSLSTGAYDQATAALCKQVGITYIPGVQEAVEAARKQGQHIDGAPYDSHWNALGHQIAGAYLLKQLVLP